MEGNPESNKNPPVIIDNNVVNYLPEEVVTEILKRLPVKSLLRFRCVLKSWNNLIQTPMFITIHLNYQKSLHKHLIFDSIYSDYLSLRYDDEQCEEHYQIDYPSGLNKVLGSDLDSCWFWISNGLLCLTNMLWAFSSSKIYLLNPAIRKYKILPDYPCIPGLTPFDVCWEALGFGFSIKRNDYLVVTIMKYSQNGERNFMGAVYSLNSNSWMEIGMDKFVDTFIVYAHECVCVNGAAFWRGKNYECEDIIVCFDMECNVMKEISVPETPDYQRDKLCLQKYDESLAFIVNNSAVNGFNIWVLEGDIGDGVVWRKISVTLSFNVDWLVLGFMNNGEIILSNLSEYKLVSCNHEKNEIKDFVDSWNLWPFVRSRDIFMTLPFTIYPFVESLEAFTFLHKVDEGCRSNDGE